MLSPLDCFQVYAVLHHVPQRTHLSQSLHLPDRPLHGVLNLLLRGEPPDTEPDGAVGHVVLRAQGPEHVAGLQRGGGTGRARAEGHVLERHQETLPLHAEEAEVTAW